MNCAYHAETPNAAFCVRCGRALCTECVRNVTGSVYCENCLADLVKGAPAASTPNARKEEVTGGASPGAAFALGLIPGVGAIYNGEFMKAAVHILVFGVLVQLSGAPGPDALLGMMTFGFYMYMPFEAYYTAKKRVMKARGIDLETPFDRLHQQIGEVKDKELWGGVALVLLGALFLLENFNFFQLDVVGRAWPVILIAAGAWFLKRHKEKVPS